MAPPSDTVSLRITLRYKSLDEFVKRYAENVSSAGLFLRTRAPKPTGTKIRFELLLADGTRALRGEGVVVTVRAGDKPGMALRFNVLDTESRATVDKVVEAHGQGSLAPTPLSTSFGGAAAAPPTASPRSPSNPGWRPMKGGRTGWQPMGGTSQPPRRAPSSIGSGLLPRRPSRAFGADTTEPPKPGPLPTRGPVLPRQPSSLPRPWSAPSSDAPPDEGPEGSKDAARTVRLSLDALPGSEAPADEAKPAELEAADTTSIDAPAEAEAADTTSIDSPSDEAEPDLDAADTTSIEGEPGPESEERKAPAREASVVDPWAAAIPGEAAASSPASQPDLEAAPREAPAEAEAPPEPAAEAPADDDAAIADAPEADEAPEDEPAEDADEAAEAEADEAPPQDGEAEDEAPADAPEIAVDAIEAADAVAAVAVAEAEAAEAEPTPDDDLAVETPAEADTPAAPDAEEEEAGEAEPEAPPEDDAAEAETPDDDDAPEAAIADAPAAPDEAAPPEAEAEADEPGPRADVEAAEAVEAEATPDDADAPAPSEAVDPSEVLRPDEGWHDAPTTALPPDGLGPAALDPPREALPRAMSSSWGEEFEVAAALTDQLAAISPLESDQISPADPRPNGGEHIPVPELAGDESQPPAPRPKAWLDEETQLDARPAAERLEAPPPEVAAPEEASEADASPAEDDGPETTEEEVEAPSHGVGEAAVQEGAFEDAPLTPAQISEVAAAVVDTASAVADGLSDIDVVVTPPIEQTLPPMVREASVDTATVQPEGIDREEDAFDAALETFISEASAQTSAMPPEGLPHVLGTDIESPLPSPEGPSPYDAAGPQLGGSAEVSADDPALATKQDAGPKTQVMQSPDFIGQLESTLDPPAVETPWPDVNQNLVLPQYRSPTQTGTEAEAPSDIESLFSEVAEELGAEPDDDAAVDAPKEAAPRDRAATLIAPPPTEAEAEPEAPEAEAHEPEADEAKAEPAEPEADEAKAEAPEPSDGPTVPEDEELAVEAERPSTRPEASPEARPEPEPVAPTSELQADAGADAEPAPQDEIPVATSADIEEAEPSVEVDEAEAPPAALAAPVADAPLDEAPTRAAEDDEHAEAAEDAPTAAEDEPPTPAAEDEAPAAEDEAPKAADPAPAAPMDEPETRVADDAPSADDDAAEVIAAAVAAPTPAAAMDDQAATRLISASAPSEPLDDEETKLAEDGAPTASEERPAPKAYEEAATEAVITRTEARTGGSASEVPADAPEAPPVRLDGETEVVSAYDATAPRPGRESTPMYSTKVQVTGVDPAAAPRQGSDPGRISRHRNPQDMLQKAREAAFSEEQTEVPPEREQVTQQVRTRAPAPEVRPGVAPRTGRVVGVELGRHWARVALFEHGDVELIGAAGSPYVPAVVAAKSDGTLVAGVKAQGIRRSHPERSVRPMAVLTAWADGEVPDITADVKSWENGEPRLRLGEGSFLFSEILETLLALLRESIAKHLGTRDFKIALGVPNELDPEARRALQQACRSQELSVARLLTEPQAMLQAYNMAERPAETVLMVDVGVSHLGVSVARRNKGQFDVVGAVELDAPCARSIDESIARMTLQELAEKASEDHTQDPAALERVIAAVEHDRPDLARAAHLEFKVQLPAPGGASGVAVERAIRLPRSRIYKVTEPVVMEICQKVQDLLRQCDVDARAVQAVLLAGSAGQFPPLVQALHGLTQVEPLAVYPGPQVVVVGLARSGVAAERAASTSKADVLHASVGIGLPGGRFGVLLRAGTKLPARMERHVPTTRDNQGEVELRIFQGDAEFTRTCTPLGRLMLTDIPKGLKGDVRIDLELTVARDGVLTATLSEPSTSAAQRLVAATEQTSEERRTQLKKVPAITSRAGRPRAKEKRGLFGRLFGRK